MSSTIRQNPAERLSTRQTRELDEQSSAVRRLQMQENTLNTNEPNLARQTTARLNTLVDQATQRTQVTPQTEADRATSTIGANGAAPLGRTNAVDELGGHEQVFGTGETRLAPATAPRVELTERVVTGAESFATNLNIAMDSVIADMRRGQTNVDQRGVRALNDTGAASRLTEGRLNLAGTSADELLSTFLKLNINDPNENVETHDKLYTLATNLRQQAIADAKKKSENAQKLKKDAEAYAKQAEMIGMVVTVVSIALTVVTFGMAAPAAVAAVGATQAATITAQQAAQNAISQAIQAVVNAIKSAVQQIVNQAANASAQTMKELILTTARQQATSLANGAAKATVDAAARQIVEEAAKQGVQISLDTARQMVIDQMTQQLVPQVTQELSQQLMDRGLNAAAETATKAGESLASELAAQTSAITNPTALQRGGQLLGQLATSSQGTMTRTTLLASGALQGVSAGANYKAADKMLDARQAQLGVTRARFRADQAQERVQEEAEIINTIMESKNQTIEAVMQMTNATWASRQQLMAASVAR